MIYGGLKTPLDRTLPQEALDNEVYWPKECMFNRNLVSDDINIKFDVCDAELN